ncbi:MAG: hypothetical protein U0871_29795 [Gemmataceae bacterium]
MPLAVQCPGCAARLTVADAAAGTVAKCPKCGTAMTVPATAPRPSRPSLRLKTPPPQPSPIADDEPPRPARRRRAEDEDDDRPARRPRDEDDEDDRPVRRKRRAKPSGPPVWVFVAAGVGALVLLAAGGVVAYLLTDRGGNGGGQPAVIRPGEGGGLLGTVAPAGWAEVRDARGGFRLYMPGTATQVDYSRVAADNAASGVTEIVGYGSLRPDAPGSGEGLRVEILSQVPPPGTAAGTTPDELFDRMFGKGGATLHFNEVVEKKPVTLGGKPGLMVTIKPKPRPNTRPARDPNEPDWIKEIDKEEDAREAKRLAGRVVHLFTHDGKRTYRIKVESPGEPDPAMLKTLIESFQLI